MLQKAREIAFDISNKTITKEAGIEKIGEEGLTQKESTEIIDAFLL